MEMLCLHCTRNALALVDVTEGQTEALARGHHDDAGLTGVHGSLVSFLLNELYVIV